MDESKLLFSFTDKQKEVISMSSMIIKSAFSEKVPFNVKITGSAGTGKTTIVAGILEEIYKGKYNFSVSIVAPTHKALSVVQSKILGFPATDPTFKSRCSFKTLASILKMERIYNYETQTTDFTMGQKTEQYALHGEKLVIIDEASMITKDQYETLLRLGEKYSIVIIFLGDVKQLPPVKENSSPAVLPEVGSNIFTFNLTEIIRQGAGNPILDIAHDLDLVRKFEANLIDGLGYFFTTDVIPVVKNLSSGGGSDMMKYLAWSNSDVDKMNMEARKLSYGSDPKELYIGETIISQSNSSGALNNEEITITALYNDFDIRSLCTEEMLNKIEAKYLSKVQYIEDPEDDLEDYVGVVCKQGVVYFLCPVYIVNGNYKVIPQKYLESFKIAVKILKQLVKVKAINWKIAVNFEEAFLKYKYAYAMTVHKSQGSTFKNVIINLRDLERNKQEFNEILYTAITRASNKVIFYYPLKKNKEEDE